MSLLNTYEIGNHDKIPMVAPMMPRGVVFSLNKAQNYNHKLMNIPEMWKISKGSGVRVAVLDTGVPSHRDISVYEVGSFVPEYEIDTNGHGTMTGGIIAANSLTDDGVKGIAPLCHGMYCAVLDEYGVGEISSIINGIYWAVDNGAEVINMSLGIPGNYRPGKDLEIACDYAASRGVTLFASAGNDGGLVNWPAAYDSVVAVGAVDKHMDEAEFSCRGDEVEFTAGGVDIYSTYLKNGYSIMSGTSFSCPSVAAMGALIISALKEHDMPSSPELVRKYLRQMSYDIGEKGKDKLYGYGIPMFTEIPDGGVIDTKKPVEIGKKRNKLIKSKVIGFFKKIINFFKKR